MNCANCRKEIPDGSNYCNVCGAMQLPAPSTTNAPKRLFRSSTDKRIAGVCGGIAEYLQIDSTIVRLIWLVLIFIPMPIVPAIVAYFVAWLVMPQAPSPVVSVSSPSTTGVPHSTQTA